MFYMSDVGASIKYDYCVHRNILQSVSNLSFDSGSFLECS